MKYVEKNEQYKKYARKVMIDNLKEVGGNFAKGACIGAVVRVTYEGVKFVAGKVLA